MNYLALFGIIRKLIIVKNTKSYLELPRDTKIYQTMLKVTKIHQKIQKDTKIYQNEPKNAIRDYKLPEVTKR